MRRLTPSSRRGFTLVEILVAMVAFGLVGLVLTRTLVMSQRVTTAQTNRAQMQSNLRAASFVVPNELRMLNQSSTTDILSVTDTSITYLAMRGYYMLCATPAASTTTLKVARVTSEDYSFDYRLPVAGDQAFVFFENDTLKMSDDAWQSVTISAVGTPGSGICNYPVIAGSSPTGMTLTLSSALTTSDATNQILVGAPIRTYEITRLSLMTSGGVKYLGMCTGDSLCTLQPVVGPLASSGGFVLTRYKDDGTVVTGNTTADRTSLRSLKVKVVGQTEQAIARGTDRSSLQVVTDSLTTTVTLRNVKKN